MAENINIDFMPNRRTADIQRVGAVEDYLKLFTDRAKFCFSSVYDEFSNIDKRLQELESFSLSTPSSVDLTVNNAVILQEKESQQVIHNYTKIHYVDGNTVGYGDISNTIICNGYSLRSQAVAVADSPKYKKMTFPKAYNISSLAFGSGVVVASASEVVIEAVVEEISSNGSKKIKVNVLYTDDSDGVRYGYTYSSFSVAANEDYCVSPYWTGITAPTEERPYGAVRIFLQAYSGSDDSWESKYSSVGTDMHVPFQSEAEFDAAVGLTNTPIELIELKDFQYLIPESQIIVDMELSPDSDNVIANSTVAKALSLKADKETVEALAEEYNSTKESFNTKINANAIKVDTSLLEIESHKNNTSNPHSVTKEQLGLGLVENKSPSEILSALNFSGENMLENATFHSNFSGWHFTNNTFSEITVKDNFACAHFSGALTKSTSMRQSVLDEVDKVNLNQLYTFSADIRLDDYVAGTTNPFVQLYFSATYDNNGTSSAFNATTVAGSPDLSQYSGQGWKRVYWTVRFTRVPNSIYAFVYARDFTGELYFRNLKLEKGSVPTAYTPSVMDFTELKDRVAVLEAAMLTMNNN